MSSQCLAECHHQSHGQQREAMQILIQKAFKTPKTTQTILKSANKSASLNIHHMSRPTQDILKQIQNSYISNCDQIELQYSTRYFYLVI